LKLLREQPQVAHSLMLPHHNAVDAGVVAVIAAGNSGPSNFTIDSPGTSRLAITVGASCMFHQVLVSSSCQENDAPTIASFSSRGFSYLYDKPEVVAPGVEINSTVPSGSCDGCSSSLYNVFSGTSMATPHVAGTAALLLQQHPDWTPAEVKAALKNTATDQGLSRIIQGSGQIDAYMVW